MTQAMWDQMGITGWQILAVAISATVLFWVFSLLMSYFRQQMRARMTITTITIMSVVGSVIARAMLGPTPTMAAGIVVLVVLIGWEAIFRLAGSRLQWRLVPVREARVVLRDGIVDDEALRRMHVRTKDLMVQIRSAGITSLDEVAFAILERDGSVTVIRVGQTVDPRLLVGVEGLPA